MPSAEDAVPLEHLAATGWFAEHGEVALTSGLTFCLQKDRAAARSFMDLLRTRIDRTEEEVPGPHRWQAESIDEKRGRPDITGWFGADAPVVLVEAKVSAEFGLDQVSSYVVSQQGRLNSAGRPMGALAVLVPEIRVHAARAEVAADLAVSRQRRVGMRGRLVANRP